MNVCRKKNQWSGGFWVHKGLRSFREGKPIEDRLGSCDPEQWAHQRLEPYLYRYPNDHQTFLGPHHGVQPKEGVHLA
jgi:hypothetical protein